MKTVLVLFSFFVSTLGSYPGLIVNESGNYTLTSTTDENKKAPLIKRNLGDDIYNTMEDEMDGREGRKFTAEVDLSPKALPGRDKLWARINTLDSLKVGNLWKQSGSDRPTLSTMRYIVQPIWWSDNNANDPLLEVKDEYINFAFDYCQDYYDEMSYGKFKFKPIIIRPQKKLKQKSEDPYPSLDSCDEEVRELLEKENYVEGVDFDGVAMVYIRVEDGYLKTGGGWANVNSNSPSVWLSWAAGLSSGVSRHEIGHNFGHPHHKTNQYDYRFGASEVTHDGFDMMSGGNPFDISQFHVASKWFFNWIPDSGVQLMQPEGANTDCSSCVKTGSFTLHAFDSKVVDDSKLYAIQIPVVLNKDIYKNDEIYSYWLSYRAGNPAVIGLSVHLSWFRSLGNGQFKTYYDQVNYDAYGHTETLDDSFVAPGTCYHISPNVEILITDPIQAMAIQPVVCVDSMTDGEKINISVEFLDPETPEEPEETLECDSSTKKFTLPSGQTRLIRVDNTGEYGEVTVDLCPSSGTANAYFYDRYPHSKDFNSSPYGYGAYRGLEVTAPCGKSSSMDYTAIFNEAWVLVESPANGQMDVEVSCKVNDCVPGQKKQGGRCVACSNNDSSCTTCEDGFFYSSGCAMIPTYKEIESSKKWRIWTPANFSFKGWWAIYDIGFYSNIDCTGTRFNDGDPIDGRHDSAGPEKAFDDSLTSKWQGRTDDNDLLWVGMEWNSAKAVKCVSVYDKKANAEVTTFRIQAWESSTNSWQNVWIVDDHIPDQRQEIPLVYSPTQPETQTPTKSPVITPETPEPTTSKPTTASPTITPNGDGYKKYQVVALSTDAINENRWGVRDLNFWSKTDCTGNKFDYGEPFDSGSVEDFGPELAFDDKTQTRWAGALDLNNKFILGMTFTSAVFVNCVSLLDVGLVGVNNFSVEAYDDASGNWVELATSGTRELGERTNVPLSTPTTKSPTKSPSTSTTKSPTKGPTSVQNGYQKWRMWSDSSFAEIPQRWSVKDVKFFSDDACETQIEGGTPIESNHHQNFVAENAFDNDDNSRWAGKVEDETTVFWIGKDFGSSTEVRCASLLDSEGTGVTNIKVQGTDSNSWVDVAEDTHVPGVRQEFEISDPTSPPTESTPAPTKSPTVSPTKSPTVLDIKTQWRLWSNAGNTEKGIRWAVADLKFYSDKQCEEELIEGETPIESAHHFENAADFAFDDDDNTRWAGKWDTIENKEFYIGMDFGSPMEVKCVTFLDIEGTGANKVEVQALYVDTWITHTVVDNHTPGEREKIKLTPLPCPIGETQLQIEIKADKNGKKNKVYFSTQDVDGKLDYAIDGKKLKKNKTFEKELCIKDDGCHSFRLTDSKGDGLCCDKGKGYYKLTLGRDEIEWSKYENGYEKVVNIGDNCSFE